ncbi:unnamed protein product (macronuclear) [Paramecium tetraurelia]|uniref:E2F/DP family winged-helix DNA-binding domain-containing protein n=1 Tax=Paramecium tetraurelia TaxID=5888 RepID=A0CER0_PARTE|nr:uncharacterized protein GSPATT00037716001 [Paramecium tetraurelia]CAK69277.1 unnamed protein product [Paramecium tetraurelia]|eukprot:XP_001436674.1 hypothetical protein (macronuclear) [Paramecium tetraurelia strain d4-2]
MDYDGEASQFPDVSRFSFNPNGVLHPKPVYSQCSFTGVKKKSFSLDGSKNKGLRNLSYKVKKIIESESQTTYRFVADKLVSEDGEQKKEEQNVKRRVYDALNVLIAAGVITKKKKFLFATPETFKSGKYYIILIGCHNKDKWQKIKEDQQMRTKKRQVLSHKKQFLINLVKKMLCIRHLITKNNNNKSLPNSQNAAETFLKDEKVDPSQVLCSQQSVQSGVLLNSYVQPQIVFQLPLLAFWSKPEDLRIVIKTQKEVTLTTKKSCSFLTEIELLQDAQHQAMVSKVFDDKAFVNFYLNLTKN